MMSEKYCTVTYTYLNNSDPAKRMTIYLGRSGGPWQPCANQKEFDQRINCLASDWKTFAAGNPRSLVPCLNEDLLKFDCKVESDLEEISISFYIIYEPVKSQ